MQPFFTLKGLNQKARRIQAETGCKLADARDRAAHEATGLKDYRQLFRTRLALYRQADDAQVQSATPAGSISARIALPIFPALASVSDGGWEPVDFDAGRWLADATDGELQTLADFDFYPEMALPYAIAESVLEESPDMQALFAYREAADDGMFDQVDIQVKFADVGAVRRWVQSHRPQIRLLPSGA